MMAARELDEALLEDARTALDALQRLIGRLEASTDRLASEVDRRSEEECDERRSGR